MGNTQLYLKDCGKLLDGFTCGGKREKLTEYLMLHSALPGRRANLELAWVLADLIAERAGEMSGRLWGLLNAWTAASTQKIPVNDPRAFPAFCAAVAMGALAAADLRFFSASLGKLRSLASDPRWRMRETVAQGLQRMLKSHPGKTLAELNTWILADKWLEIRAAAAAVAEPQQLQDAATAAKALAMHTDIIRLITKTVERQSPEFKTLRQALGYTISVVVCGIPKEGKKLLEKMALSQDKDIAWILKENKKKKRLQKIVE